MGDLVSLLVVTGYVNEGKSRYNLRFKYIPDCYFIFRQKYKEVQFEKKITEHKCNKENSWFNSAQI